MESEKRPFTKPARTIDEQIAILRERGMAFPDPMAMESVREGLLFSGYYRLEGYWFCHYIPESYPDHRFIPGTSFGDVRKEYLGDTILRSLTFAIIGYIEIAFRSVFSYTLAKNHGPFPYAPDDLGCGLSQYADAIGRLERDAGRSKDIFIRRFHEKYSNPIPPIWMMAEIMSMGEVSKWFSDYIRLPDKKEIASYFGVSERVLEPWMRMLTIIRNRCAHHNRLYGIRSFGSVPFPKRIAIAKYDSLFFRESPGCLYNIIAIACYLAEMIGRKDEAMVYVKGIRDAINDMELDEGRMGFPPGIGIDVLIRAVDGE